MPTTWTIAIDWERNGSYTDIYDDVTDRMISASWFLGMRQPYQDIADDSKLTLKLNNHDRRFSPEYSAGPLYGNLAPFRQTRIQSTDDTGVTVAGALTVPDGSGGVVDGPTGGFIDDGTYNGAASYKAARLSGDGGVISRAIMYTRVSATMHRACSPTMALPHFSCS